MFPFYAVVQKVCLTCDKIEFCKSVDYFVSCSEKYADASVEKCTCCGYRQYVFDNDGADVPVDFIDFVLAQEHSIWVAHIGSRFDSIFLFISN